MSDWSVPVRVDDVPEEGLHREIVADAETCRRIAKAAKVRALPRLGARFDVTRHGTGLRVTGDVSATVGQDCVVTLEPLENEVRETVDVVFQPARAASEQRSYQVVDLDEDEPEELRDGTVDLGAVALEFLLLGIDPYPRKPGAAFEPPPAADPSLHPFAALAALKQPKKPSGD